MNERFLHISFTFNEGPKVQELVRVFDAATPDWIRYSPNCWIVWTARPASDLMYLLKPLLDVTDAMFIVKLDMTDRNGWQPTWIWEWMDRRRELGPPPPPAPPPSDLASLFAPFAQDQNKAPSGLLSDLGKLKPK